MGDSLIALVHVHRIGNNVIVLQVLTEPKNALGKQYRKMYQMNSVTTSLLPLSLALTLLQIFETNLKSPSPLSSGKAAFHGNCAAANR